MIRLALDGIDCDPAYWVMADEALSKAEGNDEFDFQFGQRGEHPDGDEINRNEGGL